MPEVVRERREKDDRIKFLCALTEVKVLWDRWNIRIEQWIVVATVLSIISPAAQ